MRGDSRWNILAPPSPVSLLELETNVKRRYAKVSIVSYSPPDPYDNCVGDPISCLLTVVCCINACF